MNLNPTTYQTPNGWTAFVPHGEPCARFTRFVSYGHPLLTPNAVMVCLEHEHAAAKVYTLDTTQLSSREVATVFEQHELEAVLKPLFKQRPSAGFILIPLGIIACLVILGAC